MKTAEQHLLDFLKRNPSRFASAQLQRMTWRNKNGTLASPRSVVRRLEELTEQGFLDVSYVSGNAYYQIKDEHKKKQQVVEQLPNGHVRIAYV